MAPFAGKADAVPQTIRQFLVRLETDIEPDRVLTTILFTDIAASNHTAARVAAEADASEVLVTSTVKELVAGSPFAFTDRGIHELKGVDEWHLYAARDVTFNQPAVSFVGKSRE
jgi:class 3 adenylate cyclase